MGYLTVGQCSSGKLAVNVARSLTQCPQTMLPAAYFREDRGNDSASGSHGVFVDERNTTQGGWRKKVGEIEARRSVRVLDLEEIYKKLVKKLRIACIPGDARRESEGSGVLGYKNPPSGKTRPLRPQIRDWWNFWNKAILLFHVTLLHP